MGGDASVTVEAPDIDMKTPKPSEKSKSKGISCFGKQKESDIGDEYKANANIKVDTPKGKDLKVEVPKGDASVTVDAPDLDVKKSKVTGKSKSKGTSCFGKPKSTDIDGEYKASSSIKVDTPEIGELST